MKVINILFCLFLIMLNGCNADDTNTQQTTKIRKKRDLSKEESKEEKPKSKEELLREKLTGDQKKQLDWLKDALGDDGEFNKFLGYDESKIKEALEHIKSELDSCTGNNADQQKTTFKEVVKGALGDGIDNFKTSASSTCQVQKAQ
ncbi:Mlp family lipoprotein (plasmid) [Borreliella spielmanii]|uniref:Lipoprotein n=1 Tax=Borreliella spielmanii A14S TaxID=498742 RepID=B9X9K2_9SPIR|nr:Mlp family lipoprotein [Borreliella spielmanii]EEF83949.1 lipoprotein [Borreliella spielmanii A14S]